MLNEILKTLFALFLGCLLEVIVIYSAFSAGKYWHQLLNSRRRLKK
jgi:hypothetical protein